ncbi:hypothetical protein JTB14_029507 [Gonioctena quinquepunctata]|nr:hypothetical protein JTB14_029507 [Gonioctena quinquepunctata]
MDLTNSDENTYPLLTAPRCLTALQHLPPYHQQNEIKVSPKRQPEVLRKLQRGAITFAVLRGKVFEYNDNTFIKVGFTEEPAVPLKTRSIGRKRKSLESDDENSFSKSKSRKSPAKLEDLHEWSWRTRSRDNGRKVRTMPSPAWRKSIYPAVGQVVEDTTLKSLRGAYRLFCTTFCRRLLPNNPGESDVLVTFVLHRPREAVQGCAEDGRIEYPRVTRR